MVLNQLSPPKSKKTLAKELGVSRSSLYYKLKLLEAQNQVWASDFTYLLFYGRFVYLASLEDVFTRSDQGSEYRSQAYLNLLKSFNIKPSMSQKASPWQNGHKEAFYSEFKLELGHPECYTTLGELIEAIARQINYYNRDRIHTALRCPPAVFAKRFNCQPRKFSGSK